MPVVVPVKFAFAARELWFDPQDLDIAEADYAICSTERGTEIGLVTADPFEVTPDELAAPLKPVLRVATDEDLDYADDLADKGDAAMSDFRRLIKKNGLDMKPVGVEYLFGGEKAVFYFAAEDRVDFRQLVKDLSSFFHTRVDMRQIGVRDETRLAGGYATCGQELCCTRFGGQFEPVSIRMAKEQDLPLNSSKISGVCGRLMCCLRYEFEAYKDFKSRAPKKKAVIDTPLGKAKIQEYDTPREQLVLRLENGKTFRVNLSDMTCSDACKQRAAEQGCACRPDCVTRDVLEKIESPEIKLALMELDRENGVDVGDGLDKADRIASTGPTPRRRRQREEAAQGGRGGRGQQRSRGGRGGEAGAGSSEAAGGFKAGAGSASRRRRKRGTSVADSEAAGASTATATGSASATTNGAADGQPAGRRRRHHVAAEGAPEAGAMARQASGRGASGGADAERADDAAGKRRQRRRRHSGSGAAARGAEAAGAARDGGKKPVVPSVADQLSDGEVRVTRRRPGDGGGRARHARAEGAAGDAERSGAAPRDGERASGDGAPGAGDAPKRRRRRRSRKPRQDGGSDAGGTASGGAAGGTSPASS